MPQGGYRRRHRPEETVLYGIVEQPADPLFAGQEARGRALPRYVREEFESYWRCGRLAHGFVHAKCTGLSLNKHRVALSCNRRGGCSSCAARRLAETGAPRVNNGLPGGQWASACTVSPGGCRFSRPFVGGSRRNRKGSPGCLGW
ncbi:MAG: hypothetical protein GKR94_25405 [Gammaproteobacteria bacterium]|nr:hypothetical protein [Gammaproteobacteria bacterium]